MRTFHRIAVFALALLCAAPAFAPALAQSPPNYWRVEKNATQWMAVSPDQGRGLTVRLVYFVAHKPQGELSLWFPEAQRRVAWRHGEIINIGKVETLVQPYLAPLIAGSIVVKPKGDGPRIAIHSYAYDTPQGRQMMQIYIPATLGKKNPAYKEAFARMNDFWRSNSVYLAPASGS